MLNYQVMDEEQAMQERFELLKPGEYDAVIEKSVDSTSSIGNPMMDMTLSVFDEQGRSHSVRDFLVFTTKMMWKAIHCAQSAGVMPQYENGKMCSDIVYGKSVRVKIGVEEGKEIPHDKLQGKQPGSRFPDKNKVEDYLKTLDYSKASGSGGTGNYQRPAMSNQPPDDEDVPF